MGWFSKRAEVVGEPVTGGVPAVPEAVLAAVAAAPGEKVLAGAQDDRTRSWVVATSWRLLAVSDPDGTEPVRVELDRPWREVDAGSWDPDETTLSVTWVGGAAGQQWVLRRLTGPGRMPQTFRDRVTASVVLVREVNLGPRRRVRVAIRKALDTRELHEQVIPGRGNSADDAELAQAVALARAELRDQVGLPLRGE